MQDAALTDVKTAMIDLLDRRFRKACFVPEISGSLQRSNVSAEEVERALSELESAARIIVRDHYCADPHMAGIDLRIVGLVQPGGEGDVDAQASAMADIEATWRQWLGEYLASHRCS